jgi:hypothetical protein
MISSLRSKIGWFAILGSLILFFPGSNALAHFTGLNHMHPDSITKVLCPGDCYSVDIQVDLEKPPEKADVMFVLDTTSSLSDVLDEAKLESLNIMNDILSMIPNTRFGLISHRDYPAAYIYCGYSGTYGAIPDYPYRFEHNFTNVTTDIQAAVNALTAGSSGTDLPESYTRAFYETYSDPLITWRDGAKKIVINTSDNLPHDCCADCCVGGSTNTGSDPGRDGIAGTTDDLEVIYVVDSMYKYGIRLLSVIRTNTYFDPLNCYAVRTGGYGKLLKLPGYLRSVIKQLFIEELSSITILELKTDPGYEEWLGRVTPAFYFNVLTSAPVSRSFRVNICLPVGTPPGVYTFNLYAVGDQAVYCRIPVTIHHCGLPVPFLQTWWILLALLPLAIIGGIAPLK